MGYRRDRQWPLMGDPKGEQMAGLTVRIRGDVHPQWREGRRRATSADGDRREAVRVLVERGFSRSYARQLVATAESLLERGVIR